MWVSIFFTCSKRICHCSLDNYFDGHPRSSWRYAPSLSSRRWSLWLIGFIQFEKCLVLSMKRLKPGHFCIMSWDSGSCFNFVFNQAFSTSVLRREGRYCPTSGWGWIPTGFQLIPREEGAPHYPWPSMGSPPVLHWRCCRGILVSLGRCWGSCLFARPPLIPPRRYQSIQMGLEVQAFHMVSTDSKMGEETDDW